MKRIGYIGLSTPAFYDYRTPASRAPSDTRSSPNPIIEGGFGALLLYDELWFLCRSLCPDNMRSFPYVKFLDEMNRAPEIDPDWLPDATESFDPEAIVAFEKSSSAYSDVREQIRVTWDAAADNHTHMLNIGGMMLNGNSWSLKNVLFDMLVTDRLSDQVELITNSFTSRLLKAEAQGANELALSELLVLDSVPQFLNRHGPYHPCVEDVRHSTFLVEFREWIQNEAWSASTKDVREIKAEVETKLAVAQSEVFLKHLDPKSGYKSVAKTLLGVAIDAILPGVSPLVDLARQYKEENGKRSLRWQAFILDARNKVTNGT